MKHLLNLLAAVALLIWGTHLVRTGILRVFGANLRQLISRSVSNRFTAVLSGMGVTAVVQSSTATALIVSSFVGQGLVGPDKRRRMAHTKTCDRDTSQAFHEYTGRTSGQ